MKEKLLNVVKNAYAPYSNFGVGCIVVTKDGNEFQGVNVENANGTSICAERNAIDNAVGHGYRKGDFSKIYIMFENGNYGTPCFACRQVIVEFFNEEDEVISVNGNGEEKVYKVRELCPYPFDESDLNA